MREILSELQRDRKHILNLIQKNGPLSKRDIQLMTNMKLTTLNRIINDLLTAELVVEEALGESTGGRKPALYNVNSTKYYIIGIDISRTYTQIVLTNLRMQILKESRFQIESNYSTEETLNQIAYDVNNILNELKIDKKQILGVGIGTVGPLDRNKGILFNPVGFSGESWQNIAIKDNLEYRLNLPVMIDNGANTAVLSEYFYGSGKGHENIAYINCGVGIRTGAITGGKIIRSMNDKEDAFGHMVIDIDGRDCYCGNYGCVESYSSISSILKDFTRELKKGKTSLIKKRINDITYMDVFKAVEEGDAVSKEVLISSALIFGTALSNYINLLNPQLVILSGPTVHYSETFYKVSAETALRKINSDKTNIRFSKGGHFKDQAIAVGAAAMVFEACIS